MAVENNKGMVVENPLELQMIFPDGLFLFGDEHTGSAQESKEREPESETKAAVQVHTPTPEETVGSDKVKFRQNEVEPTMPDEPILDETLQKRKSLTREIRLCVDLSDASLKPFGSVSDLIARMISIIQWKGEALTLDRTDFVDLSDPQNLDTDWLFANAANAVVFGGHQLIRTGPLTDYTVMELQGCKVLFVPDIPAIMAGPETKKLFAGHLKIFFST